MIRAAIFDLDGTLVDSNDLHVQAWQETFHLRDAGAIAIFRDPADLLAHYYQSPLAG